MTSPQDPAEPQPTESSSVGAPAPSTPDEAPAAPAAATPTPSERPRPEFGEYAPEGWTWQPPAEAAAKSGPATEVPAPQFGAFAPGGATPATPQAGSARGAVTPPPAGVPHNLGVGQARPGQAQPFEAPAPGLAAAPVSTQATPPQGRPAAPVKNRKGDRIITILLLAAGAIGALNFASGFMTLPQSFGIIADAFEMTDWVAPASIGTIGMVGVFVTLAIYACTLILSIQRMRHGKLAFFIPLIGGVVAFIALMIAMSIAMGQAPELFSDLTPERMQQLIDALQQQVQ